MNDLESCSFTLPDNGLHNANFHPNQGYKLFCQMVHIIFISNYRKLDPKLKLS